MKGKEFLHQNGIFIQREWINNPFNAEVLEVRYEDLHAKPIEVLQSICKFINIDISIEKLEDIVANNSIDSLRDRVSKFGMDNDHTWKNKPVTSFFRKGLVGGYKEEMDQKLIDFFNKESKEELAYFNYL